MGLTLARPNECARVTTHPNQKLKYGFKMFDVATHRSATLFFFSKQALMISWGMTFFEYITHYQA